MFPSVKAKWHEFSEPLEGRVHWMYLDILGLVTTGVGNLVDPVSEALKLPWKLPDGTLASRQQILGDWGTIKIRQDLARLHYKYAEPVTSVRLTDEDINALVERRLVENERFFVRDLPEFATFPADAQLGIHSMAWAVGAGFTRKFPNFTRYANKRDWDAAKVACKIRTDGNPGVIPRNRRNELCFSNAATVEELKLDPSVLHWPLVASADTPSTLTDEQVLETVELTAHQALDELAEGNYGRNGPNNENDRGTDGTDGNNA